MNAVDPRFVSSGPPSLQSPIQNPKPQLTIITPVFDAAFAAGCNYMDMGMSLSTAHPTDPFNLPGVKLGDAQVRARHPTPHTSRSSPPLFTHAAVQFAQHSKWQDRGLLALVGVGGTALRPSFILI
jgi:hypothetical protein